MAQGSGSNVHGAGQMSLPHYTEPRMRAPSLANLAQNSSCPQGQSTDNLVPNRGNSPDQGSRVLRGLLFMVQLSKILKVTLRMPLALQVLPLYFTHFKVMQLAQSWLCHLRIQPPDPNKPGEEWANTEEAYWIRPQRRCSNS